MTYRTTRETQDRAFHPRTLSAAICLIAAPLLFSTSAFADTGKVSAQSGQTFRGWGMSLA